MSSSLPVAGTAVVLRDAAEGLQTLMLRRPDTGSFPGAWVFPGGRVEPGDAVAGESETDAARRAAVRETLEETGLRIADAEALSHWMPPPDIPRRYSTWFFLARDLGDEVRLNPGEIADAAWMTPEKVFSGHVDGAITLMPPTWVTLHGLLGHRTLDEAYAALGELQRYETRMTTIPGGLRAMWQGDEEHPEAPGASGARHRLTMAARPWSYERS